MPEFNLRSQILKLREDAGISQSELASKLDFTASKLSRLESGEMKINEADAARICRAIGSDRANRLAEFLDWRWSELAKPSFDHPNLSELRNAEEALQRLTELTEDPEIRNAFLKQVNSCRDALIENSKRLHSTEHQVVFIGKPGVGKTTAICASSDLRDRSHESLNKQMVFQTGSGRTTVGEVRVRYGSDYSITTIPCSLTDMEQYVRDFADSVMIAAKLAEKTGEDNISNSAEIDRLLRNMTGLKRVRKKLESGKYESTDPAINLAMEFSDRETLITEIWSRLDLPRRRRTSINLPTDSSETGLAWLARLFKDINLGNHPEFSVPERIEVTVPIPILGDSEFNITLVDTRGVDEPSAPRRDLQSYLDDERTAIVFCSDFTSAPDAAVQSIVERSVSAGLRESLIERGSLLVVTKDGEDTRVGDESTGEPVGDFEVGRSIRQEQMQTTTLSDLGVAEIPIQFLDVQNEQDCEQTRSHLVEMLRSLRRDWSASVENLIATVDHLIDNKDDAQAKAEFDAALHPIVLCLESITNFNDKNADFDGKLVQDMLKLQYVSSLRASVNRHGSWNNFNYWHGLGSGTRRNVFSRTSELRTRIKGAIEDQLNQPANQTVDGFLKHFEQQVDEELTRFFVWVENIGETAFFELFSGDDDYWAKARDRWGGGQGYKTDIADWTRTWFLESIPMDKIQFVESEIEVRWKHMIERLTDILASTETEETS